MKNRDVTISSIFIYPVKSLGGIELEESVVTPLGLEFDRWWMLVDSNGNFLTQRQIHKLCLFKLKKKNDGFEVTYENQKLLIPFYEKTEQIIEVNIWNDNVKAAPMGKEYDKWFSDITRIDCRLVRLCENTNRKTDSVYAKNGEEVAFSDAFQVLVLSKESIDNLNEKLIIKVPVNRFRPNVLLNANAPHLEDNIKNFNAGTASFSLVKPCARCIVPSIDQDTSKTNNEIISVLKKYRLFNGKIMFGQNAIVTNEGKISKGNKIKFF